MNFKDLKERTEYLIRFKPVYTENKVDRISLEIKGDTACLLVIYNENNDTTFKEWKEYSSENFTKIIEDLTFIKRDKIIKDLI